jgi:hypothetical protein
VTVADDRRLPATYVRPILDADVTPQHQSAAVVAAVQRAFSQALGPSMVAMSRFRLHIRVVEYVSHFDSGTWTGTAILQAEFRKDGSQRNQTWKGQATATRFNWLGFESSRAASKQAFRDAMTSLLSQLAATVPDERLAAAPDPKTNPDPPTPLQSGVPAPSLVPQPWILGTWGTPPGTSGSVDGVARFEFNQHGTRLTWKMTRNGWLSGVQTSQKASGDVKMTDSAVELIGTYAFSNLGNVLGRPLRFSLTRDGYRLRGYEVADDGIQSSLSLERLQ